MKKKTRLIILIPAFAAVWGLIAFRVVQYFYASDQPASDPIINTTLTTNNQTTDSTLMIWIYRDPFLDRPLISLASKDWDFSATSSSPNITISHYQQPEAEKPIIWPAIAYLGLIRNNFNGKMVAMLRINNKVILLGTLQTYNGVALQSASQNSAVVSFQNEVKTLVK